MFLQHGALNRVSIKASQDIFSSLRQTTLIDIKICLQYGKSENRVFLQHGASNKVRITTSQDMFFHGKVISCQRYVPCSYDVMFWKQDKRILRLEFGREGYRILLTTAVSAAPSRNNVSIPQFFKNITYAH